MIFVLGVVLLTLLLAGMRRPQPVAPIVQPGGRGVIDSNVRVLLSREDFQRSVLFPSRTRSDYADRLERFIDDGGVRRLLSDLPPGPTVANLATSLELDTLGRHIFPQSTIISGTCPTCVREPWAGLKGDLTVVSPPLDPPIQHLRSLLGGS